MKMLVIFFAGCLSLSAFAVTGTVNVKDLSGNKKQLSVEISGAAAEKLFNDLGDDNLVSMDASETSSGKHTVYKAGEDYTCLLEMGLNKNKVKCTIYINDKVTGKIPLQTVR